MPNTNNITTTEAKLIHTFCEEQGLPEHYENSCNHYFLALAQKLSKQYQDADKTIIIGINGCQGSGKSTLAALLELLLTKHYGKKIANLSIDDFYHTQKDRNRLAKTIHPLFQTRGVPGTHDVDLLNSTLNKLSRSKTETAIVRFNKSTDDRYPESDWDKCKGPVDIILLEGWCVGVTQQSKEALEHGINTLENDEDQQSIWRNAINEFITSQYEPLFNTLDLLIMLKAPSFDCVFDWRKKQEQKLIEANKHNTNKASGIMNTKELRRFIDHYQRLTHHMLNTLPEKADLIYQLNNEHQIIGMVENEKR